MCRSIPRWETNNSETRHGRVGLEEDTDTPKITCKPNPASLPLKSRRSGRGGARAGGSGCRPERGHDIATRCRPWQRMVIPDFGAQRSSERHTGKGVMMNSVSKASTTPRAADLICTMHALLTLAPAVQDVTKTED